MTDREIYYFTGKCLALEEHPEFKDQVIACVKSEMIDWHQFVSLCSDHLVLPAIYLKFRAYDILDHLPEDLSSHLQEVYALNVSRNTQILKQLHEIISVLKDAGYAEAYDTPDYKDIKTFKHYPRLYHPGYGATIEIHRIPVDEEFTGWFNNELIELEKQSVEDLPGSYVPSAKHKLIHNFIHGQLSNQGHLFGRLSLRGAYDLYLLSKKFPLERALTEIKPRQKAIAYFALVRRVFGLDLAFFPKRNRAYRVLYTKHALNLSSVLFYNAHRSTLFLGERIFKGYLGQIFQAFYSEEKRTYLNRRIFNRKWYGDHLRLYLKFFAKNK